MKTYVHKNIGSKPNAHQQILYKQILAYVYSTSQPAIKQEQTNDIDTTK